MTDACFLIYGGSLFCMNSIALSMDWNKLYGGSFDRDLGLLDWEPRSVRLFQVVASPNTATQQRIVYDDQDFTHTNELRDWLETVRLCHF